MARLDVDRGAQAIADYVLSFDSEMRKLMAPVGNSSLPVGRSDALVATDSAVAQKLGITITGTIGILIQAHDEKIISTEDIKIYLEQLRNSSIRLSESLIQEALSMLE